ncbi:MAG: RNA methyltransferase [Planctomycetes bacterium]|nr:RNA methyltransferase [Planctomycetota bacterium]
MNEPPPITSRRNPIIQQFRRAQEGAEPEYFVVEGLRVAEEAVRAGAPIEIALATPDAVAGDRGAALLDALRAKKIDVRIVESGVLDAASATRAPQGLVALVRRESKTPDEIFKKKPIFIVIAAGVSDPGNLGTLLRTADAAGAGGFIVSRDSVSPWNDKALRASAGSIFHIPIAANVIFKDIAASARAHETRLVATASVGGEIYHKTNLRPPIALVFGNEGGGVADNVRALCEITVRIPIKGMAESLNVAAAGAILCFEVARQRGSGA